MRRTPVLVLVVAVLLGGAIAALWQSGEGDTVRGASAIGVRFGGMDRNAAQAKLESAALRANTEDLTLRTGKGSVRINAVELGLKVDVPATVDRAVHERTPLRDLAGTVGERRIPPAGTVNRAAFDAALEKVKATLTSAATDGSVVYRSGKPVPVIPVTGDRIDPERAAEAVLAAWPESTDITIPTARVEPTVTEATVRSVATGAASRAVAQDIVLRRNGDNGAAASTVGRLTGRDISTFLSYRPDGKGELTPTVDRRAARTVLTDRLSSGVLKAKDASFTLTGGAPRVTGSTPGREVVWDPTLDAVTGAVVNQGDAKREVTATFKTVEPKISTKRANELGVKEVVSEFTTGGFADASGVNIRRVAQQVNGAVVLPGETFSLNGYTGPRGTAQGYVESGIINNGRPDKAVGGGISQFATTLYNAAYFAGLEDAGHTEHSYYISRYPEAREATVFEGAIDLQFRNDTPYGIVIEASGGASSVTVRMWSTKSRSVESITGSRSQTTQPSTIRLPKGPHCVASTGQPGFTTGNTRVITDLKSGAVTRQSRTVKYDPEPTVICE